MSATATSATRTNLDLAALARTCRQRLDPRQVPGLVRSGRAAERRVSQEEIAELVGVTPRWYGAFERGTVGQYSPEFLDRAAYALRMTPAEHKLLYYAVGREPRPAWKEDPEVSDALKATFMDAPWGAYISDEAWNYVAYNPIYACWNPWVEYVPNVVEYVLACPASKKQLVNWEQDWAAALIAQMRALHLRYPDNPKINKLIGTIYGSPARARADWDRYPAYDHPDASRRAAYLPGYSEPVEMELVACAVMRNPNWRLLHFVPITDGVAGRYPPGVGGA
jgi:transcriptional regulator with XRE-family HTH domain